jgi:hypothetical protein
MQRQLDLSRRWPLQLRQRARQSARVLAQRGGRLPGSIKATIPAPASPGSRHAAHRQQPRRRASTQAGSVPQAPRTQRRVVQPPNRPRAAATWHSSRSTTVSADVFTVRRASDNDTPRKPTSASARRWPASRWRGLKVLTGHRASRPIPDNCASTRPKRLSLTRPGSTYCRLARRAPARTVKRPTRHGPAS